MEKSSPAYLQDRFARVHPAIELVNHVYEGLNSRDELKTYIHQRAKESERSYALRLKTTVLDNKLKPGITRAAGMLSAISINEETPDVIKDLSSNIDGKGNSVENLCLQTLICLLKEGSAVLMVDWKEDRAIIELVPFLSLRNAVTDDTVQRVVIESVRYEADGYGEKPVFQYREYTGEEMSLYEKEDDSDTLVQPEEPKTLLDARGDRRGEVYAVWISIDPDAKPWMPVDPPFLSFARLNIQHMLKVSELDRIETICNLLAIKRMHPQGSDLTQPQTPIIFDPETVIEVPFGGDVTIVEPSGQAIQTTHERNKHREGILDKAVDAYLMEKQRTATEAGIADESDKSRLEIIAGELENAMSKAFTFFMKLSDRSFDADRDDAGGITVTSTVFNRVTSDEVALLTDHTREGLLASNVAQAIALEMWRDMGYGDAIDNAGEPQEILPTDPNAVIEDEEVI